MLKKHLPPYIIEHSNHFVLTILVQNIYHKIRTEWEIKQIMELPVIPVSKITFGKDTIKLTTHDDNPYSYICLVISL